METIKPSTIRKYPYEIALMILGTCVAFLFYQYNDLNKYVREDLMRQNIQQQIVIKENSDILKQIQAQLK